MDGDWDSTSGSLEIIFGPMFSGKTTELQRRIKRHTLAKKKCLVIKFLNDTRYDALNAVTHDLYDNILP